jgi:signal transduction histidine kinase/ABC-type sugar transport system substrate-binding protein/AraC-like DNA-binding protein/CheY-like chemotaxis protein
MLLGVVASVGVADQEAQVLHTLRIGARIGSADPFWVQTREAIYQHAQHLGIDLVPIDFGRTWELTAEEQIGLVEELLAQELNALICAYLPDSLAYQILERGVPVIHLTETDVRHPQFVSAYGFYDIARSVGVYLAEQLAGRGNMLIIGGLLARAGEDGRSRIAGVSEALRKFKGIDVRHIPSAWRYEHAYPQIEAALREYGRPIDAIFGLSDSLALAARDAGRALGLIDSHAVIVGVNGDPLALAAIADGSLTATVDTPAAEFGIQAVDLACTAARGEPLPAHLAYMPRLVTARNVAEVAMQKLIAIAELPSRLVGVNRQQEQQRLAQLETSLEINRRIGSVLSRQKLSHEIADLIRANYEYDTVQLLLWHEREQALALNHPGGARIPLSEAGLLGQALLRNEPVFVPDTHHSQRFPPDPRWPDTRSRVVVPIRVGGAVLGLLDLHSRRAIHHTRQSLAGLQVLADQLGIAMRNAELYEDALKALVVAEKADQLKTRLLANVSHELRTPLNVILGYSQAALADPSPYDIELPAALMRDLRHIYRSGEHLIRLINDLLDLSRAEIDELELFPETIATRAFLEDVFQSIADYPDAAQSSAVWVPQHDSSSEGRETWEPLSGQPAPESSVTYQLSLPDRLPLIQADPVRLRQILLNLLSNARKFTARGHVTLGADVEPPHLHIWVADSGAGIPADLQERIFEPFVTGRQGGQRPQGVGLGLTITRRLVALHRGTMTLESHPGRGSIFHVYLPLPSLNGQPAAQPPTDRPTLLLVSAHKTPSPAIAELCRRKGLAIFRPKPGDELHAALADVHPVALVWDLADADPADWALIERLRSFPHVCQAPFIIYDRERDAAPAAGTLGILSKPFHGSSLLEAIESLRPAEIAGPVLIVDDDARARDLYASLVAQALPGQRLQLADGGQAALEALAHDPPCLVVLDLTMPDIDGFAVLARLRADERTRHVPVIIMSGRILSFDDIARLDHAFVTFHSKDILSAEETAAALRGALDGADVLARPTSLVVKRAIGYIQHYSACALSRQQIAEAVGVSKNYLTQIFHQELGVSPWEYLSRYRIKQARQLLRDTNASITAIAAQVGFEDASYFGRVFRKQVGCSPQAYRDGEI